MVRLDILYIIIILNYETKLNFRAKIFESKRVNGSIVLKVEQFSFDEVSVISTTDGMVQCSIKGWEIIYV